MTQKEKAKELVEKFRFTKFSIISTNQRKCALICVDEMIEFIKDWTVISWDIREIMVNELEEVKKEIEKL